MKPKAPAQKKLAQPTDPSAWDDGPTLVVEMEDYVLHGITLDNRRDLRSYFHGRS
jgi:hypothetical protein